MTEHQFNDDDHFMQKFEYLTKAYISKESKLGLEFLVKNIEID